MSIDLRPEPVLVPFQTGPASSVVDVDTRAHRGSVSRGRLLGRWLRRLASEAGVVVLLSTAVYLVVAVLLDFKYLSFNGDAMARMANGFYVLYSRDPHLASIGFVWDPLQSIFDMVPLLFWHLWTPLASHMFAGSLVSVACMVGAVHQIRAALFEWGVGRAPRLILTALFALNPMIFYYSGTGMSEALYLFTLVATTRYLSRWIRKGDLHSLVYAAIALALCYLTRNEAVVPAAFGALLVAGVSLARVQGDFRARLRVAMGDVIVFIAPFVVAFVGWAVASYVIVGQPFSQFTSQYGTAAQLKAIGANGAIANIGLKSATLSAEVPFEFRALEYLAPLLPLLVVLVLLQAWRRRDALAFAPLAVVGGGLAFDVFAFFTGSLLWSFRYVIATVPLEVLLAGALLSRDPIRERSPVRPPGSSVFRRRMAGIAAAGVALVLIGPSVPATAAGMWNPHVGWQEMQIMEVPVFHRGLSPSDRNGGQHYDHVRELSDYISKMDLPDGQIVVDNFSQCIPETIVNVANPRVFVIPNDRDYQRVLADPLTFHAHYILVPNPVGTNSETTTVRAYPTLYKNGAEFARLVHTFNIGSDCGGSFRLYRVLRHPTNL